jgi:class 3 adenylate cyclase/tetratricopeptide (TPR) repeat protein
MSTSNTETHRKQLEDAIEVQESLRGTVDDAIIDATITSIKLQLASLQPTTQQRKLATILFMDIAGHTALTVALDPEEQMAVVDPAIARMAAQVDEYGGHVARYQGDGFKAVFGLPLARENDAQQAVRAALAIQQEAAAIAEELASERGLTGFAVRIGVTTGMIFAGGVTEGEDTIKGSPVNLAARLESAAEPGTVLISGDTFNHVRGIFDMRALDPIHAKGFEEPVAIYQVLAIKERSFYQGSRGVEGVETEMVGRESELKFLQDALELARVDSKIQQVTIVGEAGLGKSRLLFELESWSDLQPERVYLFRARSVQGGQSLPYSVLRSLLAFRFQILDNDPPEIIAQKLSTGLSTGTPEREDLNMRARFLGFLVGYNLELNQELTQEKDDTQLKDRAISYLVEYMQGLSYRGLVMLLVEDLHWADDSSLDVLVDLVSRLKNRPFMLVGAARPALYGRWPHWSEGQFSHTRLDLRPLSTLDSRRLVGTILKKVENVPEALRDMLVDHAEGNPFYLEELIKMLIEQRAIEKEEESWRVVTSALERVRIPQTLTGVLQGRLERLEKDERAILEQASVVGRIFWDLLLVYLQKMEDVEQGKKHVLQLLDSLRSREMVFRRESSAFGEAIEHIFKHDLLREVAYESVLLSLRREYHSRAADWLIDNSQKYGVQQPGLVAKHLLEAGRDLEAVDYLQKAGEMAVASFAHEEAVNFLSQVLDLLPVDELERRFDIHATREAAYDSRGERKRQEIEVESLEFISKRLSDPSKRAIAALRRAELAFNLGQIENMVAASERAVAWAEMSGSTRLMVQAIYYGGRLDYMADNSAACLIAMDRVLPLARQIGDRYVEASAIQWLSLKDPNDLVQALAMGNEALNIHRETGHLFGQTHALNDLANEYAYQGRLVETQLHFEQMLELARQIGNRMLEALALEGLGIYVAEPQGNLSLARQYVEKAIDIYVQIDHKNWQSLARLGYGHTLLGLGELDLAEENYRISLQLRDELGQGIRLNASRAGLARGLLAQGKIKKALDELEPILADLESGGTMLNQEIVFPFREYLSCIQVLQANEDARAEALLNDTYNLLHEHVARIPGAENRKAYLENFGFHQELIALWQAQN